MSRNIAVTPGAGVTVSTDEITTLNGSSVTAEQAQRVKVSYGAAGTATDVTSSAPLPVNFTNTTLAVTGTFWQATQPVSGTVSVSGSVAVTGTFWQATQPVSLTSLPALAAGANVIGGVTQSGTWNVGTVTTVSTVTNLSQFGGAAINLGAGAVGTGTLRTTQASDSPLVTATGAVGDTAWASGNGTVISLLKAVAGGVLDTTTLSPAKANLSTDSLINGTTALTPKFAKIAASSSGANTLVAAVTSKKIRVLAYNLIGNGAVNAKFQSHVTPTDLTGLKYIAAAGGGICAPFNPLGWFETVAGEALDLNLSGAVAVGGELVYVEV